jgi:hypothetical protein
MTVACRLEAQQVELDDCVGPGSQMCTVSPIVLEEDSCGTASYRFNGRVAWAPLKNVGPITVSVKTRIANRPQTIFPMYVELRGQGNLTDTTTCRTGLGASVLLVVQDGRSCGGNWTSIGPIELEHFGVSRGEYYRVQCVFFETIVSPFGFIGFSPAFSCIRITRDETSPVAELDWTRVKQLFK